MEIEFIPRFDLAAELLSVEALRKMWDFSMAERPDSIDLGELGLHRQLQNPSTLVSLASCDAEKLMVSKSRTTVATAAETLEVIRRFWRGQMESAERFLEARMRYDKGNASSEDVEWLGYLRDQV